MSLSSDYHRIIDFHHMAIMSSCLSTSKQLFHWVGISGDKWNLAFLHLISRIR